MEAKVGMERDEMEEEMGLGEETAEQRHGSREWSGVGSVEGWRLAVGSGKASKSRKLFFLKANVFRVY